MRGNRVRFAAVVLAATSLAVAASPTAGTRQGIAATRSVSPALGDLSAMTAVTAPGPRILQPPVLSVSPAGPHRLGEAARRSISARAKRVTTSPAPPTVAPEVQQPVPVPPPPPPPSQPNAVDCQAQKCIALTFDDGPGDYTNTLLDQLASQNVKATFFLIGSHVPAKADVVRRMAAEGHVIGDHTWSHLELAKAAPAAALSDIERGAVAIQEVTGHRPYLLRPPYGSFTKGKTPEDGMGVVFWSVDTQDWKTKDTTLVTQAALAGAKRNSIILMHDVHPTTVAAVPRIMAQLRAQGYTLVTVPQLFGSIVPGGLYVGQR